MQQIQDMVQKKERPVRIVQFGEGNFLRAFVDWMVDIANEKGVLNSGVALVKPIPYGDLEQFRKQDCLYTVLLRGRENGQAVETRRIVTAVQEAVAAHGEFDRFLALARMETVEFIVSNTTEAGIVYDENDRYDADPPASYPGKLVRFLHERWKSFSGDPEKGVMLLPVELIENNGGKLRECAEKLIVRWGLEPAFAAWVKESCRFCSTLVDRIVTGYPKGEAEAIWETLGYRDELLDVGEPFALWVIESEDPDEAQRRFPLDRAGLPVVFTRGLKPYRDRKVRILNGAHTAMVPGAFLAGQDIVRDCMHDPVIRKYLDRALQEEILPTVDLPAEEVRKFAASVIERFDNPFIDHALLSICLNSVSKWKARVLPSLLDSFQKNGALPRCLTFSFAALAAFYCGKRREDGFFGERDGISYPILDDAAVLDFFAENAGEPDGLIAKLAARTDFWGEDLTAVPGFTETAEDWFRVIRDAGMSEAFRKAAEE